VGAELRRWQRAYLAGVSPATELGAWLQRQPLTHLAAGTLFVHGGIDPALLEKTRAAGEDARDFLLRLNGVMAGAAAGAGGAGAASGDTVAEAVARAAWAEEGVHSVVEFRGYHEADEGCALVRRALAALNATRVAVGHTPGSSVRVGCGGRLLALDSSLGRWFRASGNLYCGEDEGSTRACRRHREECEGQGVRLERGADSGDGWAVRVIGAAGDEVAVWHTTEEDAKLEL
jgi:hypothetical protein